VTIGGCGTQFENEFVGMLLDIEVSALQSGLKMIILVPGSNQFAVSAIQQRSLPAISAMEVTDSTALALSLPAMDGK
jgi:hypothetical protein